MSAAAHPLIHYRSAPCRSVLSPLSPDSLCSKSHSRKNCAQPLQSKALPRFYFFAFHGTYLTKTRPAPVSLTSIPIAAILRRKLNMAHGGTSYE